jgi:hypothetical protein
MTSKRWFIVTNTDNLKFFYDCGLIVDEQAFPNNSYMHDMQAERPKGLIPCFSMDNLSDALRSAKRDDENLIACLVEIELKNIKFEQIYIQTGQRKPNEFEVVNEEDFTKLDTIEVLLPSPLPLNCIKNIFLNDTKTQKVVAQEFSLAFGEFPAKFFNSNAKLFKEQVSSKDELELDSGLSVEAVKLEDIPDRNLNYTKTFSYGGALSLGFYQTKNGRLSSELFEAFASNELEKDENCHLRPLVNWVLNHESESDLAIFYSLMFNIVSAEDDLGTIRYDLLKLFENKEQLPPGYAHVSGLAVRLRQLVERTYEDDLDTYFSKLIEAYESKAKGASKIFLLISMVFIRDHSETLLKFYHEQFSEEDYFLLAVFFGLMSGTGETPLLIRKIEGLRDWVSFKMAKLMHCSYPSKIVFDKGPSSPALIHKKYLKKSSVPKRQDALQGFCSRLKIDEEEVIAWTLTPKDEYKVKPGVITFSSRPSLYAEVDNERLEKLMLVNSIKNMDDLFDFNEVFNMFKG